MNGKDFQASLKPTYSSGAPLRFDNPAALLRSCIKSQASSNPPQLNPDL